MGKGHGRPRRKSDGNQQKLMDDLRGVGVFVEDTHTLGRGFPDIVIFNRAKGNGVLHGWTPIEIKKDAQEDLTPDEVVWWQKVGIAPIVAWDTASVFRAAGVEHVPFDEPVEVEYGVKDLMHVVH